MRVTILADSKEVEKILSRRWKLMYEHFKLNRKLLDMMGVYNSTDRILKHFNRYSKVMGLSKFNSVLYYYYIMSKRFLTVYPVWDENLKFIRTMGYIHDVHNFSYCQYAFSSNLEAQRWLYAYRMTKNWLLNDYEQSHT